MDKTVENVWGKGAMIGGRSEKNVRKLWKCKSESDGCVYEWREAAKTVRGWCERIIHSSLRMWIAKAK